MKVMLVTSFGTAVRIADSSTGTDKLFGVKIVPEAFALAGNVFDSVCGDVPDNLPWKRGVDAFGGGGCCGKAS